MKKQLAVLLSLAALFGCASSKDSAQPFDAATSAKLDAAVTQVMSDFEIPGVVVGAWVPGRGEYVAAKGVANLATGEPMRADVHFRVGSNTKAFTGTVILQLVDEGRFKLDDNIARWFPWVVRGNEITVRMMLNMTSGLVNYSELPVFERDLWAEPHRNWKRQELLDYVKAMPLMFDPGTKWHYSNTNTVLLGMIIEAETGKTVAQAFADRIYAPMGMSRTSWGGVELPQPFTHGYSYDTADKKRADTLTWNPNWADAAGQIVSTMQDMRVWARTLAVPVLISPAMHAERTKWVTVPGSSTVARYGLAMGKVGGWYHHQGTMPGYNSIAAYLPEMDATIVVFVNSETPHDGHSPAEALIIALSNILSPEYTPGR